MNACIVSIFISFAGPTNHDVSVIVDRVNRVADRHLVAKIKDVEDVGAVALGSVRDENFAGFQVDAERLVGLVDNHLRKPVVALLGAIAVKCLTLGHIVYTIMKGLEDRGSQRQGYVPDAEANNAGFGVGVGECFYAATDFGKKIAGL